MNLNHSAALAAAMLAALTASAQSYNYLNEGFEEAAWTKSGTNVVSSTGKWTSNKNVASTSQVHSGSYAVEFTTKDGLTSPMLEQGAGSVIYFGLDNNRQVYVEKSTDGSQWTAIEAYKLTEGWTRHIVPVNDPTARYIRFRTTSNKNFYIDDILITKPDGTDGDGNQVTPAVTLPYFTHTFDNAGTLPTNKEDVTTEKTYNITGQGEWKYLNAYRGTNTQYIPDGSNAGLRMLKNGSYIITPVLSQGVVSISFDEGRTAKTLNVYTSTDEGATWTLARSVKTDTYNNLLIYEPDVNRIKIANESTSDADIDNLTVTAYPGGTLATVVTNPATDITASTAVTGGAVTDGGDRAVVETGVCWGLAGNPAINSDNVVKAANVNRFTVTLTGLPAAKTISYRAYAISLAGVAYGETLSFTTEGAKTAKTVITAVEPLDDISDETAMSARVTFKVTDNGGAAVTEAGVIYAAAGSQAANVKGYPTANPDEYTATVTLDYATTYTLRPYAVNEVGRAEGEEYPYVTPGFTAPTYAHNRYYCSPDGNDATADGSEAHPFYSLQKAVDKVVPGDFIIMKPGTYNYSTRINIGAVGEKNSGRITLICEDGRAVLDFGAMSVADANQGIRLTGSYWHIYGIDICNAGDNGMLIERDKPTGGSYADIAANTHQAHHNLIENCNFYRNADTGLQMKNLATYNMVVNCDSYFNIDPGEGNADGFAVKLSHGEGNYFFGCRAWRNSDDGWDQFIKKEGGFPDDITTTLEECWAFENGYLENGNPCSGNGNGFKMGSDQGRNNIIMNRCLAFDNLQKGFDQNHNTGHMILNNCTGYAAKYTENSSHYTYRMDEPVAAEHEIRFTNCVAVSDGIADRNKSAYAPYSVTGTQVTCDFNTLPEDYVTISSEGADGPRDAAGNLPVLDFMRIRPGNAKLIDAGTPVGPYAGESVHSVGIRYEGSAPDLGCYETAGDPSAIREISTAAASGKVAMDVTTTKCGLIVINVAGVEATAESSARVFDVAGHCIASVTFTGATASVDLRGFHGVAVVSVSTPAGSAAAKIRN